MVLGSTNLTPPSAFLGPGRWRSRASPERSAAMPASASAGHAARRPARLTISMSSRSRYDGSLASRGSSSLRRMLGGTFQYGLNST